MGIGGAIIGALLSRIVWPRTEPMPQPRAEPQEDDVTISELGAELATRPLISGAGARVIARALFAGILTAASAQGLWTISANATIANLVDQAERSEAANLRLSQEIGELSKQVARLVGRLEADRR